MYIITLHIWLIWRNDITCTSYCPIFSARPYHIAYIGSISALYLSAHTQMTNIITRTALHYWGIKCCTTTTFSISSHILIWKSFWIFTTALSRRTMININIGIGRKWTRVHKTTWKRFKIKITCFRIIKLWISKSAITTKSCYQVSCCWSQCSCWLSEIRILKLFEKMKFYELKKNIFFDFRIFVLITLTNEYGVHFDVHCGVHTVQWTRS